MQAGGQDDELLGEDRQLALFGLAGEALDADYVSALGLIVQRLEPRKIQLGGPGRTPRGDNMIDGYQLTRKRRG